MTNLELFQQRMIEKKYDAYIVPTSDYHNSEYICEYFKAREFLSGFTGSQGTLVVLKESAYLWADGRYYIQAAKQIEGKNITLMKIGQPDVPTVEEFLAKTLKSGDILAFDGRVMNSAFVNRIKASLDPNVNVVYNSDLISSVWTKRPKMPYSLIYKLDDFYTGKTYAEKIEDIRKEMKAQNADYHIITSLEDQAWLYNLRGNDIKHTPVFLAFTVITSATVSLFVDSKKLDVDTNEYLQAQDVLVKPYNDFYESLKGIRGRRILIDLNKANYAILAIIDSQSNTILNQRDPSLLMKAIKNETEIKNIKIAHVRDGVAVTKFMFCVCASISTLACSLSMSSRLATVPLALMLKAPGNLAFNPVSSTRFMFPANTVFTVKGWFGHCRINLVGMPPRNLMISTFPRLASAFTCNFPGECSSNAFKSIVTCASIDDSGVRNLTSGR